MPPLSSARMNDVSGESSSFPISISAPILYEMRGIGIEMVEGGCDVCCRVEWVTLVAGASIFPPAVSLVRPADCGRGPLIPLASEYVSCSSVTFLPYESPCFTTRAICGMPADHQHKRGTLSRLDGSERKERGKVGGCARDSNPEPTA